MESIWGNEYYPLNSLLYEYSYNLVYRLSQIVRSIQTRIQSHLLLRFLWSSYTSCFPTNSIICCSSGFRLLSLQDACPSLVSQWIPRCNDHTHGHVFLVFISMKQASRILHFRYWLQWEKLIWGHTLKACHTEETGIIAKLFIPYTLYEVFLVGLWTLLSAPPSRSFGISPGFLVSRMAMSLSHTLSILHWVVKQLWNCLLDSQDIEYSVFNRKHP